MPRQFFVSICSHCHCPNQIELKNMGKSTECFRCNQVFVCKSADSQSAALNSPMSYWVRYTADLDAEEESNQATRDISRIPK